jgi:hypothetical protein
MKTVFDKATRDELIARIEQVSENSERQWGKMTVFQMLKHCTVWERWIQESKPNKQSFMGMIFGKMALRDMLKEGKPLPRNTPTSKPFKVTGIGNVAAQKAEWIGLIEQYDHYVNHGFVHDFFGKMTTEQVGYLAYKHTDHHLRQFNS